MKKLFYFHLRDKLLLAVILLVAVLMGSILLALNARLRPIGIDALKSDLNRTQEVFRSFVRERSENLADKAELIAGLPRLTAALDVKKPNFDEVAATVTELCMDLNHTVRVPLFIVTDKTGRVLYDAFHIPEVNLALLQSREPDPSKEKPLEEFAGDWPNIKKALAGDENPAGFIYTLKSDNPQVPEETLAFQTVAVPIANRDGVLGTLLLGFALDNGLAAQMNQMTDSEITFDADGKVFGATKNLQKMPSLDQALAPLVSNASLSANADSAPVSMELNGDHYLCISSPFSVANSAKPGYYVLLRSLDKARAEQETIQETILFLGLLGVAIAFGMALFLAERITAPVNTLLKGVQEVGKGNLNVRVDLKSHDELGQLGRAFNEMILGLSEKERVKDILGKYVAPQVAKKLLSSEAGPTLAGERRECAVMFTDIRGFTSFSENMGPEKLVAELNEYFTRMVDVVFKYEGTLDKFIGDAIMAVWGAPVPFEDKELRGVKCALEMQEALKHLNLKRLSNNQVPLTMGIGLNTGVVVSGNLGSDKRTDYTVIGEEVNLASRLCSKAAPGQVLISESMYRKLKGLVEVRTLDPVPLKGFSDPVKIFEVVNLVSPGT